MWPFDSKLHETFWVTNLGRDGDDTHERSTINTHKLYYAGSSSIHLSPHQSMFHTIIYEQMMLMLMKCKYQNTRQTPGVLHRPRVTRVGPSPAHDPSRSLVSASTAPMAETEAEHVGREAKEQRHQPPAPLPSMSRRPSTPTSTPPPSPFSTSRCSCPWSSTAPATTTPAGAPSSSSSWENIP